MRLPRPDSIDGQVLRLMLDGKPRSKLDITEALGLHPAKEVTARLRDYRKGAPEGYGLNIPHPVTRRMGDTTVYIYQIILDEKARPLVDALRDECLPREIAA